MKRSVISDAMATAVVLAGLLFIGATDAGAKQKLPPGEDGLAHCIIQDDGENDEVVAGENRCCYEDEVAEGEYLTMCVTCDENWRNCTEEPGSPRITTGPRTGAGAGTISEPRGTTPPKFPFKARTGAVLR